MFEANGKTYETDAETLSLLRSFRESGNEYMVGAVFAIGCDMGRIIEAGGSE